MHGYVLLQKHGTRPRCVQWCLSGIVSDTPSPASTRAHCVAPNGYFEIVLRNRALIFRVPSIRTWCVGACVGVSGRVGALISRVLCQHRHLFSRPSPIFPARNRIALLPCLPPYRTPRRDAHTQRIVRRAPAWPRGLIALQAAFTSPTRGLEFRHSHTRADECQTRSREQR